VLKEYASASSLTARTRRLLENYLTLDSRSSRDSVANRIKLCCAEDEGLRPFGGRPAEGDTKPPLAALAEDRHGER
jgi:hypothetical protein